MVRLPTSWRAPWYRFLACRAYGPGEVKVLTSADGGNFEEVVPWRRSTKGEAAYIETFMFAEPRNVMAVSILMRDPQRWRFMGITNVALLVEPGPFMLVSGAPASDGELCVVGRNGILEVQPCVAAIVAGDGAEIFSFGVDGELVSAPSKACASLSNGCVATRAVANLSWSGSAPMFIAALWPWSRAGQTLQHLSCKRRAKSKHPAMEMFVWLYPAARQTTSSQRLGALTLPSVSTRSTSSQCATLGQLGRWMHCCGSFVAFVSGLPLASTTPTSPAARQAPQVWLLRRRRAWERWSQSCGKLGLRVGWPVLTKQRASPTHMKMAPWRARNQKRQARWSERS